MTEEVLDKLKAPETHKYTSNSLAKKRTLMAMERTLLAWVRSALSFISFGFTIIKLLQSASQTFNTKSLALEGNHLGLFLMVVGTVPLAVAMYQYYRMTTDITKSPKAALFSPSFGLASIVLLLGIFVFFNVIFRWHLL